ncbi:MAG: SsrA-binding protein SmpB [candidate division KSB1 bacterium]|nr:SsrA-binding protein SmpB [candidate division KSB1 bacterium]MDZ7334216.1 SsrA-binding protein SmpB [candidate division KSB1 bacterium]MDZ7358946.1 SsrA-binding protein SmpB [candidate division KSB1 bacterium]MDZ7400909.1 SsrA-binding protein SmpB [candidate division KSB1 bacterium]
MSQKVTIANKKARFQYEILETFEAGIVLQGTEVKSLRLGKGNIQDSYATIKDGEAFIYNMHISPYEQGNIYNHDPDRIRKLLLHKQEIKRLTGKVLERGLTLVPLKIYFKKGKVKVELGLARGKSIVDRRKDIAWRDEQRIMEREFKEKGKFRIK